MKRLLILLTLIAPMTFAQSSINVFPPGASPFGELYQHDHDGGGGDDITLTTAGTYYPWITATAGHSDGVNMDAADAAGDSITIVRGGYYRVDLSMSFSATAATTFYCDVFNGTTRNDHISLARKMGANGDVGSAASSGIDFFASGDVLRIKCTASADTKTINIFTTNFTVNYLRK
jgi:hypothetical protein